MSITTISLPDELQERVKKAKLNMSDICRRALEVAVNGAEFKTADTVERSAILAESVNTKFIGKLQGIIKAAYLMSGQRTTMNIMQFRKAVKVHTGVMTNSGTEKYIENLRDFGYITADGVKITFTKKTLDDLRIENIQDGVREELDKLDSIYGVQNDTNKD